MSLRLQIYAISALIGLTTSALAGDLDRYRYVLEKSTNDKVCRHMQGVYNRHFSYPWKRPALSEPVYGANSPYAFAKRPGVSHDYRMTFDMSYSRLPSSPEFDAIEWREGRYRHTGLAGSPDHGDQPMLVAEFDIDNDGQVETVIKGRFMLTYYPAESGGTPGGEDTLFVFRKDEIDLQRPIDSPTFYSGQPGRKNPSMIALSPVGPYRIIRPFVLEGVTYLSGYQQDWDKNFDMRKVREHLHVVRYLGGGENLGPGKIGPEKWTPLQLDRICEFRMNVLKQR